jgi:hypothetical protein
MPIAAADQIVQRTTKDRRQSELPFAIGAFTHLIERLHRKLVQRCPQVHPLPQLTTAHPLCIIVLVAHRNQTEDWGRSDIQSTNVFHKNSDAGDRSARQWGDWGA